MDRLGDGLLDRDAADMTWRDLETFFKDKATQQGHLTAAEQTIRWLSTVYNRANHRLTPTAWKAQGARGGACRVSPSEGVGQRHVFSGRSCPLPGVAPATFAPWPAPCGALLQASAR
jgi:hypothetical protein